MPITIQALSSEQKLKLALSYLDRNENLYHIFLIGYQYGEVKLKMIDNDTFEISGVYYESASPNSISPTSFKIQLPTTFLDQMVDIEIAYREQLLTRIHQFIQEKR